QRLAQSAKFGQMTWNNRPAGTGGTVTVPSMGRPRPPWLPGHATMWEIDVAAQVQTMINTGQKFGGRIARADKVRREFISLNSTFSRPTLFVAWSDAPQTPTSLVPSGNQVVGVQYPILQWDFTDVGGNRELTAIQVQIDGNASWDAPLFSSGTVA